MAYLAEFPTSCLFHNQEESGCLNYNKLSYFLNGPFLASFSFLFVFSLQLYQLGHNHCPNLLFPNGRSAKGVVNICWRVIAPLRDVTRYLPTSGLIIGDTKQVLRRSKKIPEKNKHGFTCSEEEGGVGRLSPLKSKQRTLAVGGRISVHLVSSSVTRKNRQISIKVAQK